MKYKGYKNIIELAHERGSKARTKQGAWGFLLKNMKPDRKSWKTYSDVHSLSEYVLHKTAERAEKMAIRLGYDIGDKNTPGRVLDRKEIYETLFESKCTNLMSVTTYNVGALYKFREKFYRAVEHAYYDYNYYAKSYGHPKKTVTGRTVEMTSFDEFFNKKTVSVEVESFRGNYFLEAVAKLNNCKLGKKDKITLGTCYGKKLIRAHKGLKLYARTFLGETIDFCLVGTGITYHAETQHACFAGFKQKKQEKEMIAAEKINVKTAIDAGFCETGVYAFCREFDLDAKESYTRSDIKKAINGHNCKHYAPELKALGIVIRNH